MAPPEVESPGLGYDLEPDVLAAARPIAWAVPDGERRRRPGGPSRRGWP